MNQPISLAAAQVTTPLVNVRCPLVPVALAAGLGVWWERTWPVPGIWLCFLIISAAITWLWTLRRGSDGRQVVLLWILAGLLAATWHRVSQTWPPKAIGHFALNDRVLVQIRGEVAEEFTLVGPRRPELYSLPQHSASTVGLVRVTQLRIGQDWQPVSGLVRIAGEGDFSHYRLGDGVEVVGVLVGLSPAINPGGADARQTLLDQGVQATLRVKSGDAIRSWLSGRRWSVEVALARVRASIRRTFQTLLPEPQAGVAQALLCGEQSALTPDQFDAYLQTGVYHVLAVSGQHLVVLCAFVAICLRFWGGSLRSRAIWLAAFVLLYMLLTGAKPPVIRAAVIVCAWCGALWLGRTSQPLNSLALAWLVVAVVQPADLANTGCLLSFVAVWLLIQVIGPWHRWDQARLTPLDRLEARLRPVWLQVGYWLGHQIRWAFLIAVVVWLGTAPLIAERFHLLSPAAILIGPLLSLFMMAALILGFLVVILGGIPFLGPGLASLMNIFLVGSDEMVQVVRKLPWSYGYCPDLPDWWIGAFYAGLIVVTLLPRWWRGWKLWSGLAISWLLLGIALVQPKNPTVLRMTVLAVGHGTAVVLETPDGRCLLYDAGSLSGPDVAQRHISAYLWSRGRTKIDEVILSHADLDHFNALPDLADRFRIGQVRCTPTFTEKPNVGTRATLRALRRGGIPLAATTRGTMLQAGEVNLEVLHPPHSGPSGVENVRSLVLLVTYAGRSALFTGDLEKAGLDMVLARPLAPVDVLIAPHHGSNAANTEQVAQWCRPGLVISSETFPRGPKSDPYSPLGATLWRTWIHGGATVEISPNGIQAITHLTGQRWTSRR